MKTKFEFHFLGILIIIGGICMLIATILHPILVNPYDGETAFRGFSHSPFWMWDHILMLVGTVLWLLGLAGSRSFHSQGMIATRMGSSLFYISLGLWILTLTAELTVLPLLGEEVLLSSNSSLFNVWVSTFSYLLLSGYFAVACGWLGIFFYGWGIRSSFSAIFQKGALYSGGIGFIGVLLTCLSFKIGYVVIPITSAFPYIWSMWLGWKMLRVNE
ncbi:hypothetical protein J6TS2_09950 [Heyndrickxia sporothermodurans]|nr:hypothetical protein J6TS2_09950 [Heyndrickxia sporothermodurans]